MPNQKSPHPEHHFRASETVRDIVIGMADGLTVPFALAAGLTGIQQATSKLIITAGLAEVAAGSIAMGLGGYLAARSEAQHYEAERAREEREIVELPEVEAAEVREVLQGFGLNEEQSTQVTAELEKRPKAYVDFMMRFELGLEEPDPKRALQSALNIAVSYIVGGMIPLSPYFVIADARQALPYSIGLTLIALLAFGGIKGAVMGLSAWRNALQTAIIGGFAAAAAFGIARLIS
jgi:VIT1/CCC1 family predicted Fe2+/Mn2+ transporter